MGEEIKEILNKFDGVLKNYELDKAFGQLSVDSICHLFPSEIITIKNYIQQKENIIKEVREDLDKQITFCTNEANGTTNDKYCRIAINYLKHLKDKLDKGE